MKRGFTVLNFISAVAFGLFVAWFLIWIADGINQKPGNTTGTDSSLQSTVIQGQNIPTPTGYVNDTAGVLSPATVSANEAKLVAFSESGKGEVAVLIVKSLNGLSIEEYGIRVGEAWKVGKYGVDNGNILIISTGDRKVRIETGSGSSITDGEAAKIISDYMLPSLKKNDWDNAVSNGVEGIIKGTYDN